MQFFCPWCFEEHQAWEDNKGLLRAPGQMSSQTPHNHSPQGQTYRQSATAGKSGWWCFVCKKKLDHPGYHCANKHCQHTVCLTHINWCKMCEET